MTTTTTSAPTATFTSGRLAQLAIVLPLLMAAGCDTSEDFDQFEEASYDDYDYDEGDEDLGESFEGPAIDADALTENDYDDACFDCGYAGPLANAFHPNMCLHKAHSGWGNGNPIHLWDCGYPWESNAENKMWFWDKATKMIRAVHNPEKCIHKNWGEANGTPLAVWDCGYPWDSNWANKLWEFDNGMIRLLANQNKCLVKNWGAGNGTNIQLWDCGYPWEGDAENKLWLVL